VPDNDSEYADRQKNLQEKLAVFHSSGNCAYVGPYFNVPAISGSQIIDQVTTIAGQTQYTLTGITSAQLAGGIVTVSFNNVTQPESEWSLAGNILSLADIPTAGIVVTIILSPYDFYKLGTVIFNNDKEVQYVQPHELLELNLSPLTKPTLYYPVYKYNDYKIYVYPTSIVGNISVTYLRKPLNPTWNFTSAAPYYQYVYNPITSVNFELHPTEQINVITKILLYSGIVIKDPQIIQVAAQQIQAENINSKS
jgi:hypothetical protein